MHFRPNWPHIDNKGAMRGFPACGLEVIHSPSLYYRGRLFEQELLRRVEVQVAAAAGHIY